CWAFLRSRPARQPRSRIIRDPERRIMRRRFRRAESRRDSGFDARSVPKVTYAGQPFIVLLTSVSRAWRSSTANSVPTLSGSQGTFIHADFDFLSSPERKVELSSSTRLRVHGSVAADTPS